MDTLRNDTGSLWPANPKWPVARSLPGCGLLAMKSFTVDRSASRMRVPFSSTWIREPFTVTSWKFHVPAGRWYPRAAAAMP